MASPNPLNMREIEHLLIPLNDGRRLAARIWLPTNSENNPTPAILEYLPYRKRDGTAPRDATNYPYLAAAGYAGVRVDISGHGESDGDYDDEYSPRELADGVEVIHWIASQPWCDGDVGMMGISWGGFNCLQIAALKPAPLKAIISIGSTADRYNDDIHYKHGCQLYSNFQWSSTMLCFASRPPDPLLVGDNWRDMWRHRLETQPFPLQTWLAHQRRDEYWKHGSICEDFGAIQIPSLVISGWGDGYINAPPTMAANINARAVNGPWIHKYPHFAWPRPRMDFNAESLQWWDRWLKGMENGAEKVPAYRAYISEGVKPGGRREHEPGRWVMESTWPSESIRPVPLYLSSQLTLEADSSPDSGQNLSICSPLDTGTACGEFFPLKPDSEMSGDQRTDDAGSLVFNGAVLNESFDILGRPELSLTVAIDRPLGNLAARLIDVHPDGSAHRVSWGVLNLSHRLSQEQPSQMQPGKAEQITILLDHCGYRFLPGHRIRLAISTSYWPTIVPPPELVTATIRPGSSSFLVLPCRPEGGDITVPEPENLELLPDWPQHQPASHSRNVTRDLHGECTTYRVFDDTGEGEILPHGMHNRHTHEEVWQIKSDDPLSYTASSTYVSEISRGDWSTRTVSESSLTLDAENFYIKATVTAWEGEQQFNQRSWQQTIPRDFM